MTIGESAHYAQPWALLKKAFLQAHPAHTTPQKYSPYTLQMGMSPFSPDPAFYQPFIRCGAPGFDTEKNPMAFVEPKVYFENSQPEDENPFEPSDTSSYHLTSLGFHDDHLVTTPVPELHSGDPSLGDPAHITHRSPFDTPKSTRHESLLREVDGGSYSGMGITQLKNIIQHNEHLKMAVRAATGKRYDQCKKDDTELLRRIVESYAEHSPLYSTSSTGKRNKKR
jgi:hypothetical protein